MFYSSKIVFMQLSPQLQAFEHFKDRCTHVHLRVPHARSVEEPQHASCTQGAETGSSVVSVGFRMPSSKFHLFWTWKNRARFQGFLPYECLQLRTPDVEKKLHFE